MDSTLEGVEMSDNYNKLVVVASDSYTCRVVVLDNYRSLAASSYMNKSARYRCTWRVLDSLPCRAWGKRTYKACRSAWVFCSVSVYELVSWSWMAFE